MYVIDSVSDNLSMVELFLDAGAVINHVVVWSFVM